MSPYLLLIPAVLGYLVLAGLFRTLNIYRQTHGSPSHQYDNADAGMAAVFWPVYLLCLILLACVKIAPWIIVTVAMAREKRLQGKSEGITSTADYRKYKQWIEDYERNLPVGER